MRLPIYPLTICLLVGASSADGRETVRFQKRPAQVGDALRHSVDCELQADLVIRHGNQVVDSERQGLRKEQRRTLTLLSVAKQGPARARLIYHAASKTARRADEPPQREEEAVAGKSYLVARNGDELHIRNAEGEIPSPPELAIVQANMQTFGLPNPLAEFLDGKTFAVGETVELPEDVAKELMGLAGQVGEITRFSMTLVSTERVDDAPCAVFDTLLQASAEDHGTMTLLMKGRLVIQVLTCRTVAITMDGPVAISETRGPPQGQFIVSTQGQLNVAVRAQYGQRR
jgi:hypothetical protein